MSAKGPRPAPIYVITKVLIEVGQSGVASCRIGKPSRSPTPSAGGPSHRLPDSLTDLWRSKRAATEALPRLLHELQPSLRKYDYYRILHHRRFEWGGALYALFVFAIMILFLISFPNEAAGERLGTLSIGLLALAILFLSFLLPRRLRNRCRKQMGWILAQENARRAA